MKTTLLKTTTTWLMLTIPAITFCTEQTPPELLFLEGSDSSVDLNKGILSRQEIMLSLKQRLLESEKELGHLNQVASHSKQSLKTDMLWVGLDLNLNVGLGSILSARLTPGMFVMLSPKKRGL